MGGVLNVVNKGPEKFTVRHSVLVIFNNFRFLEAGSKKRDALGLPAFAEVMAALATAVVSLPPYSLKHPWFRV